MYPVLFKIGDTNIYSYGVCLIIAIVTSILLFSNEFKKKNLDTYIAPLIIIFAIISFCFGGTLLFLFNIFDSSFLGALIILFLLIFVFSKAANKPALEIYDLVSIPLILVYGIVRIGCQLAGDGHYGIIISKDSAWSFLGMSYENGTLPTPPGVLVHPVPVYEIIICIGILWYLWQKRTEWNTPGRIFSLFLVLMGIERFIIEFITVSPPAFAELTIQQLLSIFMIIAGVTIFMQNKKSWEHSILTT